MALKRRELPDYLPLYLEYLSLRPAGEARQGLLDIAPILALVGGRLQQSQSDYSALFDALLTLANSPLSSNGMAQQIAGEPRDDTRDALDAVWEEERVTFMDDNPCNRRAVRQHQRRCRDDVQPYYLHPTAGGKR
ncbi:putative nitrate reductase molybdenum cofactor assembly chaperone NarW [Sodalis praecaptivus]|nr:putative nitrate reductase molybdenum cofactor assembly chaperone NarW [Sodalis praecaptivus]